MRAQAHLASLSVYLQRGKKVRFDLSSHYISLYSCWILVPFSSKINDLEHFVIVGCIFAMIFVKNIWKRLNLKRDDFNKYENISNPHNFFSNSVTYSFFD